MNTLAALLRGILRFAVVGALVVIGVVGFFVAWWLVLIAVLALSVYIGVRRFFGIRAAPPPGAAGGVIIEGEFEVERDGANGAGRTRGRIIEVLPDPLPPGQGDKNSH